MWLGHCGLQLWGVCLLLAALSHHSGQQTGAGSRPGHAGPRWEGQRWHAPYCPLCEKHKHTFVFGICAPSLLIPVKVFIPLTGKLSHLFFPHHLGVYYWSWQKIKAVPALPSHHRTQFWWDLEGGGLAPAHSREASSHTCRLEGMPCIWKWPQLLPVITAAEGTDNSYRTWAAAVLTSRLFAMCLFLQPGNCVMVPPSMSEEEAASLFPAGVYTKDLPSGKKYLRYTPQP